MKTLVLIRHAKSSWEHPDLPDHDRPLSPRGIRNAPAMATFLSRILTPPDAIVASSAVRARETAKIFAKTWEIPLATDSGLYMATIDFFTDYLRDLPEHQSSVALVAHDPGLSDFVNILTNSKVEHLPTCASAIFRWDITDWEQAAVTAVHSWRFDTPKGRTNSFNWQ